MLLAEAKIKANAEIARCVEIINRVYKTNFTAAPIAWDVRGVTAGYVKRDWLVHLNPGLLCQHPHEIEPTAAHEFAHLVDAKINPETRDTRIQFTESGRFRRQKRSIHGPTWAAIMVHLGHKPDRCHQMDTSKVRVKARIRHIYRCPVCSREGLVGPKHHKAIQLRGATVWFKMCGSGHKLDKSCYIGRPLTERDVPPAYVPQPKVPASIPQTPPQREAIPPARIMTKQERVISMMRTYPPGTTRAEFVRLIMQNLGMTKAGAETYYYNAKKRIEQERHVKKLVEDTRKMYPAQVDQHA